MFRRSALFPLLALTVWLIGCGGGSSNNPGGSSGNPTGSTTTPSTAPTTYQAGVFHTSGGASEGTITVNTSANNGSGTLQLTSADSISPMVLQFCPFQFSSTNCVTLANFTPASNGARVDFKFTQQGTFSGVFQITQGGNQVLVGGIDSSAAAVGFQSALLPASGVTGGINKAVGNASLSSGSVTVSGGSTRITLAGAPPNKGFTVCVCSLHASGPTHLLGNITTDGSGNVSATLGAPPAGFPGVFALEDSTGTQFVSAIRVQ